MTEFPGQAGPAHAATGQAATGQAGAGHADRRRFQSGQAVVAGLRAFLAFWYGAVVGDDWVIAAGVAAALALTYALSQTAMPAWWLMPAAVGLLLPLSLRRLTRRR